jgi:Rrf2 family protein
MISQTAEYALRAVVFLADQEGNPCTVSQIADATQVPTGYLAKVMQMLSRARLVNSQRGIKGGFSLAAEPSGLSVLKVVNAVDPIRRFPECPLGIASHGKQLCPLHKRLDDAAEMVERAFREAMVTDLLTVPRARKTRCRFPSAAETTT